MHLHKNGTKLSVATAGFNDAALDRQGSTPAFGGWG